MSEGEIKVLIIDDDVAFLSSLSQNLRDRGFYADTSERISEASYLINRNDGAYDVILLDQVLDDKVVNVFDFIQEVREKYHKIQIVVMTGFGSVESGVKALQAGAYRYVMKPLSLDEIEIILKSARDMANIDEKIETLYDISRKLVHSTLSFDEVVNLIIKESLNLTGGIFASVQLFNEDNQNLTLYDLETLADRNLVQETPGIGITGRAVEERKSQLVGDVTKDPDFISYVPEVRSEIAVPLLDGKNIIGVLNVESTKLNAFDEKDLELLESFANQAAVAIRNAQQYEKLKKAYDKIEESQQELVTVEVIAWMGMIGSTWAHTVNQRTGQIRYHAAFLRRLINENKQEEALTIIKQIDDAAADIQQTFSPRLESERELENVEMNELLRVQVTKMYQSRSDIDVRFEFDQDNNALIKAHRQWIATAVQYLLDNAIRAMPEGGKLTVSTQVDSDQLLIEISDTGIGISPDIQVQLFKQPVSKAKGTGLGLLLTKLILRRYSGDIKLLKTGPLGTTFRISLPTAIQ